MGNQLVSSVKTVIRPIDFYLNEVPDLKFKCSLGQTQFLKVALCTHTEGDIVVKVLSHEDPSLLLEQYRRELLDLAKITSKNVSIASFRIVEIRTNFAYMTRQFVRYSLYDRLSTRPFLTDTEKSWIIFQVFKCMQWCHERQIYHGDLKLENILITSNLWVVMSDFASYKPIRLPEDNPTFFNYFFDTSRRRCCNISPERFVPSNYNSQLENNVAASYIQQQNSNIFNMFMQEGQLTSKMDMFSLGCILAEIYSDNFLFDLGGLLKYKDQKNDYLEELLEKIQNEQIKNVVRNLISLDPSERQSCHQVIDELTEAKFFPKYFNELYSLMDHLIRLPPDAKILYLTQEIDYFSNSIIKENPKGLLILLMTLTSSLRSLKHIFCKIEAQKMICRLAMASPSLCPFITDRLIPYLVDCLNDNDHRVRGEAINSITQLLEQVSRLPSSDNNLFTDYLMEKFQQCMTNEKSVYVRICMAKNICRLSKIALNFLNQYCDQNYDQELNLLHKYFHNLVSILITDSNNCVRRVLMMTPESCAQLCTFFGRQKTNEVILSHIITFLNDKNDFKLRISFFDNIVVIASYLGVQCSTILHPLLQQGLCDAEEIVIGKTINSIASLVEQGLIAKNVLIELLKEVMPLIHHPNLWITNSIIHFLSNLTSSMSLIDLNIKVLPVLSSFFKIDTECFSAQVFPRSFFDKPIPRNIYDTVLLARDQEILNSFFELLKIKFSLNANDDDDVDISQYKHNAIYKRLSAENITPTMERQLLILNDLLIKIYRNRKNFLAMNRHLEFSDLIELKDHTIRPKAIRLNAPNQFPNRNYGDDEGASSANQEWLHMFGPNNSGLLPSTNTKPHEIKDADCLYFECPPYIRDIQVLEQHKKNSFVPFSPITPSYSTHIRPRGFLVAHLYEHKSSVNKMTRFQMSNMFVTCSDDGSVRLWDICDDPSRYVISRSRYQFRMEFVNGSPVNFKNIINCGQYIITCSNDGQLHVFEVEESSLVLTCSFKVGNNKSSITYLITWINALTDNLFAVSLTNSCIYIYDTRYFNSPFFNVPVMKMQTPPSQRVITSMDGNALILFAATASGYISGFDLRFQLKVSNYVYNSKESTRIAQIRYTPIGLLSSVYGNLDVTLWDYKFGQKSKILSPANNRPEQNSSGSVINAILPLMNDSSMAVITGGSDMRIRYWDLNEPENSYIISDPLFKPCNYCLANKYLSNSNKKNITCPSQPTSTSGVGQSPSKRSNIGSSGNRMIATTGWYQTSTSGGSNNNNANGSANSSNNNNNGQQPVPLATFQAINQEDGLIKIQEIETLSAYNSYQTVHHCSLDQQLFSFTHQDSITDLIDVQQYLISCGRNGAVKVWR